MLIHVFLNTYGFMVSCCHLTGECVCDSGYGDTDCSVLIHARVNISGLLDAGLCDEHDVPCTHAWVFAFPIVDSPELTCQLVEFSVSHTFENK